MVMASHHVQLRRRMSQASSDSTSPRMCRRRPNTCCFCWCCCCSCLTVRNKDKHDCSRRASIISQMESLQKHGESRSLSLEEVTAWSQSFEQLLKNPTGRGILMEFLQSEHSDENILFWLACEELKQEDHKATITEMAKSIYLDYISILSPKEVSIDASVRETINKNMAMPTADMFDEAQVQIYALMHRDSYPRFLNSPMYKSLLQNVTASGNALDCDDHSSTVPNTKNQGDTKDFPTKDYEELNSQASCGDSSHTS
ncbi:regulator of G-protein signaling 17-like isoform X1 [Cetorhinus maximus]